MDAVKPTVSPSLTVLTVGGRTAASLCTLLCPYTESSVAAVAIDTVTLFGNLEVLYLLFIKSLKAHTVFEDVLKI